VLTQKLQVRTTQLELELSASQGPSRWRELFRGTNLRRTEITVLAWLFQDACGNILTNNAIYVFEQAGIDQSTAFKLGLGTSGLQLVANFGNFYLMYLMGRRTLYMMGFAILDVNLMLVGIMAIFGVGGRNEGWAKWAQASFQMVRRFCPTQRRPSDVVEDFQYWLHRPARSSLLRNYRRDVIHPTP
jgi:SP family general alpha glucoside:H+ symporter-like MFS transporter